jgi:putative intracellular protease/amidase
MKFAYFLVTAFCLICFTVNGEEAKAVSHQKTEQKKVLFVLTSHDKLGNTDEKTGFWLEEFAAPYYYLLDKGVKITVASPEGGKAPVDPRSKAEASQTDATRRFSKDENVQKIINNTVKLENVKAEEFDAVFYPGGHGPLWDLAEDETSIALIESFNKQKKPMAFVCHAPAVLKEVKDTKGDPLVKGKKVTGFTNEEEEGVNLTDVVPFLLEKTLKKKGGIFTSVANWNVNVVQDGNLITGQNPASSEKVAQMLYDALK